MRHVHHRGCYDDPGPGHGSPARICGKVEGATERPDLDRLKAALAAYREAMGETGAALDAMENVELLALVEARRAFEENAATALEDVILWVEALELERRDFDRAVATYEADIHGLRTELAQVRASGERLVAGVEGDRSAAQCAADRHQRDATGLRLAANDAAALLGQALEELAREPEAARHFPDDVRSVLGLLERALARRWGDEEEKGGDLG